MPSDYQEPRARQQPSKGGEAAPCADFEVPQWFAVYTRSNHEKSVAAQFESRHIEHFLPLYKSVRRWKDRRVTLGLPLFPGYLFVKMIPHDRLPVIQVPGVARLVGFGGHPAALPAGDIEALRAGLASGAEAKPHPLLREGRPVRLKSGPMFGLEGLLVRRKNQSRLIVSVELIRRAVSLEVDEADIEGVT